MRTITKSKTAYKWLRRQAQVASSNHFAHVLFDVVFDAANDAFDSGEPMRGLELEFWTPFTDSLAGRRGHSEVRKISAPVAAFVGDLLADLGCRGATGSVSVEQAVMMLISALGWSNDFKLISPTEHAPGYLKSRRRFEDRHSVAFLVPIKWSVMADLHFALGLSS